MTLKRVLVTGGNGFIGSYVVDRLVQDGIEVVIFDHNSDGIRRVARHSNVEVFLGDIRDEVAVTEAMSHVDGFIHLAGVLGTQETIDNPTPAIMTNITAGLNILEAATQYDVPGVNIAVGNHWENNPYSISKSTVERLVVMYQKYRGARVSSVRALNAYGPGQSVYAPYGTSKVRKIIPSFVSRVMHGEKIQVYGDGEQVMDMVYVDDVAKTLVRALYHTAEFGPRQTTIEAGTGVHTTVKYIAESVIDTIGYGEIEYLPLRPGETPGAVVVADTDTLPGQAKDFVQLREGLIPTIEYYRGLFDAE